MIAAHKTALFLMCRGFIVNFRNRRCGYDKNSPGYTQVYDVHLMDRKDTEDGLVFTFNVGNDVYECRWNKTTDEIDIDEMLPREQTQIHVDIKVDQQQRQETQHG